MWRERRCVCACARERGGEGSDARAEPAVPHHLQRECERASDPVCVCVRERDSARVQGTPDAGARTHCVSPGQLPPQRGSQ